MCETLVVDSHDGDTVVAAVLAAGPGPWAATQLAGLRLAQVSEPARPDLLWAWAAQEAWTQARSAALLAEYLGPAPAADPDSSRFPEAVTDAGLGWRMRLGEAGLSLRVSPQTLRNRHVVAFDLATRLPATRAGLEAGTLSWVHRCVFPDCGQPAPPLRADHHPPWRQDGTGGSTSAADMAMICRQHHNWLTHGGWQLDHLPDGSHRFTSPTGRVHLTRAEPTLPTDGD